MLGRGCVSKSMMQGGADLNLKPERPAPKNLPDGRCGPCKLIQPTLVEWANEFAEARWSLSGLSARRKTRRLGPR